MHSAILVVPGPPDSVELTNLFTFFDYAVVNQRRYMASSRTNKMEDCLIAITSLPGRYWAGELVHIFLPVQENLDTGPKYLGIIKWFCPLSSTQLPDVYRDL